jgi:phytoene/squalene synthetase
LQVLEHCQDVGEDFHRGRVYLPAADLRDAGVPQEDLGRSTTSPALRRAVARQVARARESLAEGAPLVRNLRGWARFAVAGYVAGGLATADALEQAAYDVLGRKVEPASSATIRHAVPLLVGFSR